MFQVTPAVSTAPAAQPAVPGATATAAPLRQPVPPATAAQPPPPATAAAAVPDAQKPAQPVPPQTMPHKVATYAVGERGTSVIWRMCACRSRLNLCRPRGDRDIDIN